MKTGAPHHLYGYPGHGMIVGDADAVLTAMFGGPDQNCHVIKWRFVQTFHGGSVAHYLAALAASRAARERARQLRTV